jgi:hypothetical protein
LQRKAAATAEAVAIAAQKTRACRALLEVQEAAASALEAALKKCEEEISEIQAEVQQESIFELERSACREDTTRSSPVGTDASLMQAGGEGRLAGTTSTNEADAKFIGMLERDLGTGRGRRTIPGEAVEVEGVFAGTAEFA